MARRAYNQFCGLARSLDVVGERWTMLLVRELMSGPKRYTDLAEVLPGIGSGLLAARLRQLEKDGLARQRRLPPPAAATVYELTAAGRELGRALLPLALWGARHRAGDRQPGETYRAEWGLVFLVQLLDAAALADAEYVFRFRFAESTAYLRTGPRGLTITAGPLDFVDATIVAEPETVMSIGAGRLELMDAVSTGAIVLEGEADALRALRTALPAVRGESQPGAD